MKKRSSEYLWSCVAVAMLLSLSSCAKRENPSSLLPALKREITIAHRYLNLPVKTGERARRMSLTAGGDKIHDFDIELAEGAPDFWVFIDVSELVGKTVLLEIDQPDESNPAILDLITQDDRIKDSDGLYKEKYRPRFHFTSRRGWMGAGDGTPGPAELG